MSVLIKGMEIPKSCDKCPLKTYVGVDLLGCKITGYMFYVWDVGFGDKPYIRHESCQLIEVPEPHGRLIDADDMIKRAKKWQDSPDDYIQRRNKDIVYYLEKEDTIIPASEEGM